MIETFTKYLITEKRSSIHTVSSYRTDLLQLETFLLNQVEVVAIEKASHDQLRSWVVSLVNQKNSPKSVNRKISSVNTFFQFLLKREIVSENPTTKLKSLKTNKSIPHFVQKEEMNTILNDISFEQSFEGYRDQLILETLYGTGIRRAELINIKEYDVDIYAQTIKIFGKRSKERIVPFSSHLSSLFRAYIKVKREAVDNKNDTLFVTSTGNPCYPMLIDRIVKKYLTVASQVSKKSPHVLRHTYATHILNNGGDLNAIKELLGHTSLASTEKYTHNSMDKLKSIFDQAHPKAK